MIGRTRAMGRDVQLLEATGVELSQEKLANE